MCGRWNVQLRSIAALAVIVGGALPAAASPISLRAAIDAALRAHPRLDRVAADLQVATARLGRTRAGFLPQVSTSANLRDDVRDPLDFLASQPIGWGNNVTYDAALNVRQLVTDSGRTRGQIDGAREAESQARAQLAVDRLDIEQAVIQAYLDVLESVELVAVSTGAIAMVEQQRDRATALFKATLRPEIDVLSAETQLSQSRLARLRDENAVETARLALRNAIGSTEPVLPEVDPIAIQPVTGEDMPLSDLATRASRARAEVEVIRRQIAGAEASERVARKRTAPVVTASAGAYANGGTDAWVPGVGVFASLGVSADLYVGDANRYEVHEAHAQVRRAQAEHERVVQAVSLAVGRTALAVKISREGLSFATAWRVQAERQLQLAQSRYQSGVGNFVELNDARGGLVSAQRQEVQARYDLAQSRVALAREMGQHPSAYAGAP